MTNIVPCPRCGGDATIHKDAIGYYVKCLNCNSIKEGYVPSKEEIASWNEGTTPLTDGSSDKRVNANPMFCCKGLFDILLHRQDVCILDGKFLTIRGPDIWDTPIMYCPSCGKEIHLTFLADSEVDG